MKHNKQNITPDEILQNILNRKNEVSRNTAKIIYYINFLLNDCINVSVPNIVNLDFPTIHFGPFVKKASPVFDSQHSCQVFSYQFDFPKTATADWISDDSILKIVCKIYDNEQNMQDDPDGRGSITTISAYDSTTGKQKIDMSFVICTAMSCKFYYIGNYEILTYNSIFSKEIESVIEHEINYANKQDITYSSSDEYVKSYSLLMHIIREYKTSRSEEMTETVQIIAECIYRYSNEINLKTYAEYFYEQWTDLFGNSCIYAIENGFKHHGVFDKCISDSRRKEIAEKTEIYRECTVLHDWLESHKDILFQEEISKKLYNLFKDIASFFLKLNYAEYNKKYICWCKEFIYRIETYINSFQKKCMNSIAFVENTDIPIRDQIEEYRQRQY